ncbi:MAG TPA: 4-alpha-glucanotransferase [Candidatus Binataceae bacterium]|nr:4-alpha-glucanotransferase [Candidatus Binataceae bacterium]
MYLMLQRSAGILIPLFSLRSAEDLGRGEIMHMKAMIDFAISLGHRVIQLLPLDETAPSEASPYAALTLYALDPLYISAHELPGVGKTALRRAHKDAGDSSRRIARERYVAIKRELLERAFEAFASRARVRERRALDDFIAENSYWIHDYALFRALKDHFDFRSWDEWPSELAHREQGALASARHELAQSVHKYCWLQYIAHRQWKQVRDYAKERGVFIGGDLAFSPGRDSDAVWTRQSDFDLTRTIGTPPDAFSETGQRWGLPMPNWTAMRADGFQLWRSRARHARALYDLVRIDHVVGLYRTFSFGADDPVTVKGKFMPEEEEDQRAQGEAVLNAIKEEAGDMQLIAEDLGTVPKWVRKSLTELDIPGYKVMQWERDWDAADQPFRKPADYPALSLATTGTHDTVALTLWWRAQPIEERARLVKDFALDGRVNVRAPLGMPVLNEILRALYAAPSMITVLPIQDLFGWCARINLPGTVSEANWTYRLPIPFERMTNSHSIQSRAHDLKAIASESGRF